MYLDNNGTTPIDPRVTEAILPFLTTHFGNPSSSHVFGQAPHEALATARHNVATLLGCEPGEVTFTSGGTEAINWVLKGAMQALKVARPHQQGHVVTAVNEHVAVLETCKYLTTCGFAVTYVGMGRDGAVSVDDVVAAVRDDTWLVTLMHSNNETGVMNPVAEVSAALRSRFPDRHILVHTDASQSVGKVPTRVAELGVDFLNIAGHKLYAPKGVGVLFVSSDARVPALVPLMHGAGQERGKRAGTENIPYCVGLGVACTCFSKGAGNVLSACSGFA